MKKSSRKHEEAEKPTRTTKAPLGKRLRRNRPKMYRTNMRDVPKVDGSQAQGRLGRHAGAVPDRQDIRRRRPCRRLDRAEARGTPRTTPASQLRRVLHRAQGSRPHLHATRARSPRVKATSYIRRAPAGTASTTRRTRTSCWCGVGWEPARSRRPATKRRSGKPRRDEHVMKLWEDPRVVRGMRAQLELRRRRLDGGDEPLGWKVGFGAPAMLERLGISGPLVGFLTRSARVRSGETSRSPAGRSRSPSRKSPSISAATSPPAPTCEAAAAAIAGISPAIEIVDLTSPPEDPERILSGNIYQRHVVLAGAGPARAGAAADGLTCRIIRRGSEFARTDRPAGQHRRVGRHRAPRRRRARSLRRAPAQRRDHHHRLGGAAARDRTRRGGRSPSRSIRSAASRCGFSDASNDGQ